MAKTLPRITNYFGLVVSKGTPAAIGSRAEEIGSVIGIGEDWHEQQKDVPTGGVVQLWTRTTDPLFDFLRITLLTPGVLSLALTYDTPTSWTNLAPSGSRQRTYHMTLSGCNVFTLSSPFALTSPTVEPTSISGGVPAVLAASDKSYALLYRLQVKNTGNTVVRYRFNASSVFGN